MDVCLLYNYIKGTYRYVLTNAIELWLCFNHKK